MASGLPHPPRGPRRPPDPRYRWERRVLVAVVALCALAVVVLVLTACRPGTLSPATGTVQHTRTEPAVNGGTRVVATIVDAEGRTWNVRLDADTACVEGAAYPACAG